MESVQPKGRKNSGRKRKYACQNREIKKQKVNSNQDYVSASGKIIKKREFTGDIFDCRCPKKCTQKVDANIRREEFTKYWKSGSFPARCEIILGNVKEKKVNRSYVKGKASRRTATRLYYIGGVDVCKKTFLNTYKISQSRIDIALKKLNEQELTDRRGTGGGWNKIGSENSKKS